MVILKTDAEAKQGNRVGIYRRNVTINGRRSWKSKSSAIWFHPTSQNWIVGPREKIGNLYCGISSYDGTNATNPYDIPSNAWKYYDSEGEVWKNSERGNIIIQSFKGEIQ